jgi:hypothetical protein
MPGHSTPDHASQRQFAQRILAYAAQVILSTLMSLAVIVLERRIRKALRSNAGSDRRTGQVEAGT